MATRLPLDIRQPQVVAQRRITASQQQQRQPPAAASTVASPTAVHHTRKCGLFSRRCADFMTLWLCLCLVFAWPPAGYPAPYPGAPPPGKTGSMRSAIMTARLTKVTQCSMMQSLWCAHLTSYPMHLPLLTLQRHLPAVAAGYGAPPPPGECFSGGQLGIAGDPAVQARTGFWPHQSQAQALLWS